MPDYSKMTTEEFDHCLQRLIVEVSSSGELLSIPGIYEVLSEHFNNEVLDLWARENPILAEPPLIFDALPAENPSGLSDRYTVIPRHGEYEGNTRHFLGCSRGGWAVSQWGELDKSPDFGHLGRRITLDDLDPETRNHIINRL